MNKEPAGKRNPTLKNMTKNEDPQRERERERERDPDALSTRRASPTRRHSQKKLKEHDPEKRESSTLRHNSLN